MVTTLSRITTSWSCDSQGSTGDLPGEVTHVAVGNGRLYLAMTEREVL